MAFVVFLSTVNASSTKDCTASLSIKLTVTASNKNYYSFGSGTDALVISDTDTSVLQGEGFYSYSGDDYTTYTTISSNYSFLGSTREPYDDSGTQVVTEFTYEITGSSSGVTSQTASFSYDSTYGGKATYPTQTDTDTSFYTSISAPFSKRTATSYTEYGFGTGYFDNSKTTTISNAELTRKTTTEYSYTAWEKSTTFSSAISESYLTSREYTIVTTTSEFCLGVYQNEDPLPFIKANDFTKSIIIQPHCGFNWTWDKNNMSYLIVIQDTGTYKISDLSLSINDNVSQTSYSREKVTKYPNTSFKYTADDTVTIIDEKKSTVYYNIFNSDSTTSTSVSYEQGLFFSNNKFSTNSDYITSGSYGWPIKQTSSSSFIIDSAVSEIRWNNTETSNTFAVGFFTTTRMITIPTTTSAINFISYHTFTSSESYIKLIPTTTTNSYEYSPRLTTFVFSKTTNFIDSYQETSPEHTAEGKTGVSSKEEGTQCDANYTTFIKDYYALFTGPLETFYTQKAQPTNFVICKTGTANEVRYVKSLSPFNALTNVYFNLYKYERPYGFPDVDEIGANFFALPINFTDTSEQSAGTISYTTEQKVSIDSGFYSGAGSAYISQTLRTYGQTSFSTKTFTLVYQIDEATFSSLYCGLEDGINNVMGQREPSGIYYTEGILKTTSGAGYTMNGKYYYSGSITKTSGVTPNPISPKDAFLGQYDKMFVYSSYANDNALGALIIETQKVNSYYYY